MNPPKRRPLAVPSMDSAPRDAAEHPAVRDAQARALAALKSADAKGPSWLQVARDEIAQLNAALPDDAVPKDEP